MRQFDIGGRFPADLAFTADGRGLLGVIFCHLLYWDLTAGGEQPAWIDEYKGVHFRLAASPCGRYAAVAEDRCLVVWDLAARTPARWLMAGDYQHIADVAFTPDGREVLTVLEGGGVAGRRTGSWRRRPGFGSARGKLGGRRASFGGQLAVSPDGRTLATDHCQGVKGDESGPNPSGIKLWDLSIGAHRRTVVCGPGSINQLAFSPDGRFLAAQHDYRRVRLYDAHTLALRAEHTPTQPKRGKKTDTVLRIAFHPGGRLLGVSGGSEVTLLDVDGLRPVAAFDWKIGRTFGLAFSSDGGLGAVSGEDGRVVVWDID
jgi:WD40 repeat protein